MGKNRNGTKKHYIERVYNVVIPCKYIFSLIKRYDKDHRHVFSEVHLKKSIQGILDKALLEQKGANFERYVSLD